MAGGGSGLTSRIFGTLHILTLQYKGASPTGRGGTSRFFHCHPKRRNAAFAIESETGLGHCALLIPSFDARPRATLAISTPMYSPAVISLGTLEPDHCKLDKCS